MQVVRPDTVDFIGTDTFPKEGFTLDSELISLVNALEVYLHFTFFIYENAQIKC